MVAARARYRRVLTPTLGIQEGSISEIPAISRSPRRRPLSALPPLARTAARRQRRQQPPRRVQPAIDPGGNWVAYEVGTVDAKADKNFSHIWMTAFDGSRSVQLTSREKESESTPRWSPDGRYLALHLLAHRQA